MLLSQLPPELLYHVLNLLPQSTISRLCLTCTEIHKACLPVLYSHLRLSFRSHIRQLESGLRQRPFLRQTLEKYTKQLTLVCRQSGSHWLITDLQQCLLSRLSRVRTLSLVDFPVLSTENLCQLASSLPFVTQLEFRYCNLVAPESFTRPVQLFKHATRLSFFWTDFTQAAMAHLISRLPELTSVHFGANHNRIHAANNSALQILREHCPRVQDLSVSLQQVDESTLCDVIEHYGPQLRQLSFRCDSPRTLKAVAMYAIHLKDLTVRAAGAPLSSVAISRQRQQQQQQGVDELDPMLGSDRGEERIEGSIVGVLRSCQGLDHLEMTSWTVEDIPDVIWRAMAAVALRRRGKITEENVADDRTFLATDQQSCDMDSANASLFYESSTNIGHEQVWVYYLDDQASRADNGIQWRQLGYLKKTLDLDCEELQEIRKLFDADAVY